ncbi:serine hydrolase domain-containing protein [Fodinibius sediminis]|uniref:CubicO group peptidase, beta-lactamase class C family n=1 Tax=Fodinibius sediminis TaxID=1214077 RepID=A0A521D9N6_9BACT|nr:serine hydrolase domain-containing protein [Fodinibius sediminis]SMO68417.1 CubicO group peptidase, beta-lactamase class C family [Fodinibius sediminis]
MKYLLTLFFPLVSFIASAQTPSIQTSPPLSEATAISQGMSEERLARIDTMLDEAVGEQQIPGAVALVARNGKIIYHKALGMADNTSGRPLRKNDIFRIASQTKAITSTAVMMLWEEGKFQLDDPISKYIPAFEEARVLDSLMVKDTTYTTIPANKPITIRHLLTHTSGIGYGMIDGDDRFRKIYQKAGVTDLFTTKDITIGESVRKLAELPLHHHPGEGYTYSEGLDVLGYFIETLSGMPLNEFFRTRIFDPLGMDDTWFYLPDSKADRLVPVQTTEDGRWVRYPVTFYDPNYPVKGARQFYSGGAGLSSTARDYATFLQMYLNKGELNGVRLLSRTTVQFMMSNQIGDLWEGNGKHYGLAFGVVNQRGENLGGMGSKGTFDWGGYFNTQYFADPQERIIGILLKQTQGTSDPTGWKFRQLVGQAVDD